MNKQLIGDKWFEVLKEEFELQYFIDLKEKLKEEYSKYKIYPAPGNIFRAFLLTPPDKVRVVWCGQDCYPNGDHADGLAFSSQQEETPFSLQRILRECDRDVIKTTNYKEFKEAFPSNDLTSWAKKGVLLLNSALTVRAGEVGSHQHLGWDKFILATLKYINNKEDCIQFIAFGKEAANLIEQLEVKEQHRYIYTGHPATGAHGKDLFSGCNIFSKINYHFWKKGLQEIDWKLN